VRPKTVRGSGLAKRFSAGRNLKTYFAKKHSAIEAGRQKKGPARLAGNGGPGLIEIAESLESSAPAARHSGGRWTWKI